MYLTEQETFDAVYSRLAEQGFKRSRKHDDSKCAYRGADNHVCAVGALIPDAVYQPQLETYPWRELYRSAYLPVSEEVYESRILGDLMVAHDDGITPEIMFNNLRVVALTRRLMIPTLNQKDQ